MRRSTIFAGVVYAAAIALYDKDLRRTLRALGRAITVSRR